MRAWASQGSHGFLGAQGRGGRGDKKVGPGPKAATPSRSSRGSGNRGKLRMDIFLELFPKFVAHNSNPIVDKGVLGQV